MSVWKYAKYFDPQVSTANQLSIGEGDTELVEVPEIASRCGVDTLYLKKEYENPTGSHKDRGLAYQISAHLDQGRREFVISSSGNAAISAARICSKAGLKLQIFLSEKTPDSKLQRLGKYSDPNETSQEIHSSKRPVSDAFKFAKSSGAVLLRGSTDPYATEGFKTIAFELAEQLPEATQIFIPTSSGTTAQGVYNGYSQLAAKNTVKMPQIHIVQTTNVNTFAREFDCDFEPSKESIAQAIVDRVGHRREDVIDAVRSSGGSGWIVDDNEISKALTELHEKEFTCSAEGAMTIAAVKKAVSKGWELKVPVCIITGTQ